MTTLSIVLGILTWCLISVLIGLVGSRRKIGFAWTFVLSLILIGVFFGWMKKLHKKIYTRSHKDFTKNP